MKKDKGKVLRDIADVLAQVSKCPECETKITKKPWRTRRIRVELYL